jgi:GDP-L-fucose synthase
MVSVWGTGTPRREFLHVDDCAAACLHLLDLAEPALRALLDDAAAPALVNIGTGFDVSIAELAERVAQTVDFNGEIVFDLTHPDGTPRKLLDTTRIAATGWEPRRGLEAGLRQAYQDFRTRFAGA